MEINGTYYCPGNIVIQHGEVNEIENPEQQMLIDYFKLDLKNKTLQVYDERVEDCFTEAFYDIEKIDIVRNKEKRTRKINIHQKNQEEPIIIEIDEDNQIIGYENLTIKQVGYGFLTFNRTLQQLELPELEEIGDHSLHWNRNLVQLELPQVRKIGRFFLASNKGLKQLNMPYIEGVTNRLCEIVEGNSQLNEPKVDEEKFEQIHNKAKGKINEVMPQIKSFLKSNDKENDER